MVIRRLFDWRLAPFIAASTLLVCIATAGTETNAAPGKVQGVLIDKECSPNAETRLVPTPSPHLEGGMLWAYTHTKKCLLMPACQRSGYGVFAYDTNKFMAFDAAGNQKALALIQSSKKDDDMRIEVTGQVQGDKIKVATLKLLP